MCRLSWNLRASTSWNPQGLSRPVMGLLLLWYARDSPYGVCPIYRVFVGKYRKYAFAFVIRLFHMPHVLDSYWNVMAHGDAREGKWRRNWRMECVASTLHTTSKHDVYPALLPLMRTPRLPVVDWTDAPRRRFKWTRPFRWKTKSGFCACAITFQLASTTLNSITLNTWWHVQIMSCTPQFHKSSSHSVSFSLKISPQQSRTNTCWNF